MTDTNSIAKRKETALAAGEEGIMVNCAIIVLITQPTFLLTEKQAAESLRLKRDTQTAANAVC